MPFVQAFLLPLCLTSTATSATNARGATSAGDVTCSLQTAREHSNLPPTMPDIDYLFRGYDLMRGNPKSTEADVDPGYLEPIFATTYVFQKRSSDRRYLIPDGIEVSVVNSCTTEFEFMQMANEKSYQDGMRTKQHDRSITKKGSRQKHENS